MSEFDNAAADFQAELKNRRLETPAQAARSMINFLGIQGFENVPDEDLYQVLRRQETTSILQCFYREFMEIGERQSQALGEIGGEVLTSFNNVQEFIGITLKDLAKKMPELGDDLPREVTEEFRVAGLLEILRRRILDPVLIIVDPVYPWNEELFEEYEQFWKTEGHRYKEVVQTLGSKDKQAINSYMIGRLDQRDQGWWEAKTREEEGLILSYLKDKGKGVLEHMRFFSRRKKEAFNLPEIKLLVRLISKADSLAAIKKVISVEDLLKKLEINLD